MVGIYIANAGPGAEQALCDAGDAAVGGGGVTADGFLTQSQPLPFSVGDVPVGWQVDAKKADSTDAFVTAWAVCVF